MDPGDPIALDDDIHGADRRRTGAVDHRGAAQDEALERPLSLGTGRRIRNMTRALSVRGEWRQDKQRREE